MEMTFMLKSDLIRILDIIMPHCLISSPSAAYFTYIYIYIYIYDMCAPMHRLIPMSMCTY